MSNKEINKLLNRYKRLGTRIGIGQTRGDADIRDEMDEIIIKLKLLDVPDYIIYEDEAKLKKLSPKKRKKKKDTKIALRSSKDKKYTGHTRYG